MGMLSRNKNAPTSKEATLSIPMSDSDPLPLMSPTGTDDSTTSTSPKSNHKHNHNQQNHINNTPKQIKRQMQIGSKTDLVLSPDGLSVQLAPETPKKHTSKKALLSDSTTKSPIFRNDIKQEWIDAMFGTDFFPSTPGTNATQYTPPKEGVGLAQIPSYLSFTATIAVPKDRDASSTQKVGVTLSRIPIGVYVRSVSIQSEAYAAGIIPGSILIDINGMGVLGEPSHKLLERLWVFEGHFASIYEKEEAKFSESILQGEEEEQTPIDPKAKGLNGPVVLTFIKDGQLYNTVLFSGSPFGISWAPCSNFALVQRAYSFAKKAGLSRGCIVAAVNYKSLREMDHLDTAMELKDQFTKGQDIRLVCIFTPAASRTNYHKNHGKNSTPGNKGNDFKSMDGVRIRKVNMMKKKQAQGEKPIEYGVGSFLTCGTGANYTPMTSGSEHDFISDLANRVAAGEIAAPAGMTRGKGSFERIILDKALALQKSEKVDDEALGRSLMKSFKEYNDCPTLHWDEVTPRWNYFDALIFSLRMHAASYEEEKFSAIGGVVGGSNGKSLLLDQGIASASDCGEGGHVALHTDCANLNLLRSLQDTTNSHDTIRSYLLQIVALISSEQLHAAIEILIDSKIGQKDAKQMVQDEAKKICDEIVDIIVDIAIRDGDLCQSLHFLLRSFGSSYTSDEPETGLNMLSSAHQLLRKKLLEHDDRHLMNASLQISPSSVSNDSIFEFGDLASASSMSAFSVIDNVPKKNKRLGKFGKIFKSRSKKDSSIAEESESEFSVSVPASEAHDAESQNSPSKAKRKLGFIPTSILRKSPDQAPQDSGYIGGALPEIRSIAALYKNMGLFLANLDELSGNIERSLLKPFSQKITEWALQPWSASKDRALAESTADLRSGLRGLNEKESTKGGKLSASRWSPVLNPLDSSELLLSVVPEESYILPSAHFPLLLTFDSCPCVPSRSSVKMLHRTQIRVVSIRDESEDRENSSYVVHACIGGAVEESGRSALEPYYGSKTHRWHDRNILEFESRLPVKPQTIQLRISSCPLQFAGNDLGGANGEKITSSSTEIGYGFVDIGEGWNPDSPKKTTYSMDVLSYNGQKDFDQSGFLEEEPVLAAQTLKLELEVVTESIPLCHSTNHGSLNQTRMLLYKHDEDMRQEMLAIQFLEVCDHILKSSGLDLKMKKYKCIAVGENKGFIEWVPGAISLSELCKTMGNKSFRQSPDKNRNRRKSGSGPELDTSIHGSDISEAFVRTGAWCKHESLRAMRQDIRKEARHGIGLSGNNPIQDFMRNNAYDPDAPYFIRKDVMDNFVKSCAGYCVVTYLLGVGDRHTDNLLLHPQGHFFHCDYSFILGQDPKTFLPMRITEDMVNGMGGKDSDNFAKFLSLAGAAFVSLRQPSSVRILMSLVQGMFFTRIPDISINQNPDDALKFLYDRFCLNLNDDDAVAFLEENIERSLTSRIWIAVDTIHSLGKHF